MHIWAPHTLQATVRRDEQDYVSAKGCETWTIVWSILAVVWAGICAVILAAIIFGPIIFLYTAAQTVSDSLNS